MSARRPLGSTAGCELWAEWSSTVSEAADEAQPVGAGKGSIEEDTDVGIHRASLGWNNGRATRIAVAAGM